MDGAWVYVSDIAKHVQNDEPCTGKVLYEEKCADVSLSLGALTEDEKQSLLDGCLINYYRR